GEPHGRRALEAGGSVATRAAQRRGRASEVGDAGSVTASTRPRMQAAQPVSHSSQKMLESPGSSARTNPSPPQTNSPTTILVFHFFPMTGLSLMRLGAGRARLPRVRLRPKRDTTLSRRARAHIPRKYEMGLSRPTAPAHHHVAGPALPRRWTRLAAVPLDPP